MSKLWFLKETLDARASLENTLILGKIGGKKGTMEDKMVR